MKRLWRISALLIALGIVLAACGSSSENVADAADVEQSEQAEQIEETSTTTTEPPDTTTTAPPETTTTVAPDTTTEVPSTLSTTGDAGVFSDFGTAVLGASELPDVSDDEVSCLNDELAGIDSAAGFGDLAPGDQVQAIEASIDCAPEAFRSIFISGFAVDAGDLDASLFESIGTEAGGCVYDALAVDDADQTNRISALVYADADQAAPVEAVGPGANLLADCADFGTIVSSLAGDDPELAGVIDQTCVQDSFDRDASVDIYSALLTDPDAFDSDAVPEPLLGLFTCFDFGTLLAEQFGAGDIVTEVEVTCINELFQSPEVLDGFVGGDEASPDALAGIFECFEPDTLNAVLGGG